MQLLEPMLEENAIVRVFHLILQPQDLIVCICACHQVCVSHMEYSSNQWRMFLLKESTGTSFRPLSRLEITGISPTDCIRKSIRGEKKHNFAYWYDWFHLWHRGRQHRNWTNWIIHVIMWRYYSTEIELNIQESNKEQTSTDAAAVLTRRERVLPAKTL